MTERSRSASPQRAASKGCVQNQVGDLLECDAQVLAQQCNCITRHSHGLSAAIAKRLGVNPYASRTGQSRNVADPESSAVPGTVSLHCTADGRFVACLYAQWAPGTTRKRYPSYERAAAERGIHEDAGARQAWFAQCLEVLGQEVDQRGLTSVAFPHQIGCALAGGSWSVYREMLEAWAAARPHLSVRIVKLAEK